MDEDLDNKLGMARRVMTYLEDPANKPVWDGKSPTRFTTRAAELYTGVESWAALGAAQGIGLKGSADQQNIYEKAVEDAAHPLARAIHEFYKENNAADEAAQWKLTLSDWRRMTEEALLGKAQLLATKLRELNDATPPLGEEFGINKPALQNLDARIADYAEAIGKPTARRSQRKSMTSELEPKWQAVRAILEAMDNLVVQFANKQFVKGWFAARLIDDRGHGAREKAPAPPA